MAGTETRRSGGALGFIVSLLAPGVGHGIIGHAGRGAAWLWALLATWCLTVAAAAIWLPALGVGAAASAAVALGCAVDAARVPRTKIQAAGWVALGVTIFLVFVVAPVGLSAALRAFVVEAFKIPSGSMCPTLGVGDHVFVDKGAYRSRTPAHGDVIVHLQATSAGTEAAFIRRVVGVEGDEVRIAAGRVTLSGQAGRVTALGTKGCDGQDLFEEELGRAHTIALGGLSDGETRVFTVPPGHLFLMGDNRDNSHDSRFIGPVATSTVVGRAAVVWLDSTGVTWRDIR